MTHQQPHRIPGIPYVTVPERNFVKQYTRGTVASVYDMIEKDLLEGITLFLNDKSYCSSKISFYQSGGLCFCFEILFVQERLR